MTTEPIPVGDEADAAGLPKALLPIAAQVPDAVPAMPPPSKTEVEPRRVEAPVPDVAPPMPEHVVLLAVSPIGDVPDVNGLTPGDRALSHPWECRWGQPAEPGPMPSGDVIPSGDVPGAMPIPPTCADTEPQPKRVAAIAAINKRFI